MVIMKSGKRLMTERAELPNQEKIRTLREQKTYKYQGILEADTIKLVEIKEKKRKRNISGERENYSKPNYVTEISSARKKIQMDKRIRKLMTMLKALHLKDVVDRLCVSRKEGRRRLASIQDSVNASIQRLEDYVKKRRERLITATRKK